MSMEDNGMVVSKLSCPVHRGVCSAAPTTRHQCEDGADRSSAGTHRHSVDVDLDISGELGQFSYASGGLLISSS